jgi:hypothetical protein
MSDNSVTLHRVINTVLHHHKSNYNQLRKDQKWS